MVQLRMLFYCKFSVEFSAIEMHSHDIALYKFSILFYSTDYCIKNFEDRSIFCGLWPKNNGLL